MELLLLRAYFEKGTNGEIYICGGLICNSIELPWLHNQHGISCIPEGSYMLLLRYSRQHGEHLLVANVPDRDLILVHPDNNALTELKGCIAPVTNNTGAGTGDFSREAFNLIMEAATAAIHRNEPLLITIKKK